MTRRVENYKLVFVGDSRSGKTCLLKKLLTGTFCCNHAPTDGVDVHTYETQDGERLVRFTVWDTGGASDFTGMRDGYYLNGDLFAFFCSRDDTQSVSNLSQWTRDVRRVVGDLCPSRCVVVLNKKDLGDTQASALFASLRIKLPVLHLSVLEPHNDVALFSHFVHRTRRLSSGQ